uniref:hypothetical protein n=1 Tax=Paraburkholderia terrae TaxID=311230 RepID=UPI00296AEEA5
QVLDVGHLRHVPHYAQPGTSLQALNSYAAAKKSRCRPAQGRRVKLDNKSRMPAKTPANQTAAREARRQSADASENASKSNGGA